MRRSLSVAILLLLVIIALLQGTRWAAGGLPEPPQVAFISANPRQPGVYWLDAGRGLGGLAIREPTLTRHTDIAWSTDRQWLAYRRVVNINIDIFLMSMTDHQPRRLTDSGKNNHAPDWSPDGRWIAFSSMQDDNPEIYIMDATCALENRRCTQPPLRLTIQPTTDDFPDWSPDARQLAFHSNRNGDYEIYFIKADGSGEQALTSGGGRNMFPDWSPDGRRIVFVSERDRNAEIYVIDLASGDLQRLTHSAEFEFFPQWSPDGAAILFERTVAGGDFETYLMNADGSGLHRLTDGSQSLRSPNWR